ncbi:Noc2p family-domain-containing protein [Gigaspora rosea]|uniref:Noc2p family-domain-containing protein n=1 Tax=Gigaspora rosea TaxID=44941 RepID=A0A397V829_9GLOM|nr:Noc2p family-domain-containing protein [Gigaspora rosea]
MGKIKKSTKKFQKQHLKETIEKRHKAQKLKKAIAKKKNNASRKKEKKKEDLLDVRKEIIEKDEEVEEEEDSDEMEDQEFDQVKTNQSSIKSNEVSKHKEQLESLKEKDPEFYKYLQENDLDLLNFDISDDDDDDDFIDNFDDNYDSESDENDDEEELLSNESKKNCESMQVDNSNHSLKKTEIGNANNSIPTLTTATLEKLQEAITQSYSLRSLQKLLLAFRAAAHINDDEEKRYSYKINDAAVFNNLVVICLKYTTGVFDHHLTRQNKNLTNEKLPYTHRKWKTLEPLVKSFLSSILYMLKQVTENDMIYFIVRESEKAVPYYACFSKLSKHYLKQLLNIWGTAEDKARIAAFLNIRKLASIAPPPFIDLCLKGIYTTFVQYCKETTIFTIPSINLMCNCAVEMYGINLKSSYQSAFNYIRQLAIHLRNSINNKNEETFNSVYNWQYIHCIEYWSKVLANYCDQTRESTNNKGSLQELIYPLVQVCTGVIRLNITAQYFPLHFHCIRSLIHLIKKTGTFIPLAPYLFDILLSAEIHRKPKLATLKPLDFSSTLKTPKVYLHTKVYQDGICDELVELLFEYYSCYSLSIAFPELAIPAIIQVKRHIKNSKNVKFNRQLQQFVEKLEQNSKFIEQERSRIDFSPNNRAQVKAFLRNVGSDSTPLGEYVKATRELKEQRQKLMAIDSTNE